MDSGHNHLKMDLPLFQRMEQRKPTVKTTSLPKEYVSPQVAHRFSTAWHNALGGGVRQNTQQLHNAAEVAMLFSSTPLDDLLLSFDKTPITPVDIAPKSSLFTPIRDRPALAQASTLYAPKKDPSYKIEYPASIPPSSNSSTTTTNYSYEFVLAKHLTRQGGSVQTNTNLHGGDSTTGVLYSFLQSTHKPRTAKNHHAYQPNAEANSNSSK